MLNDTQQKVLHALNISIPAIAGYTTRARMIVENQKRAGWDPAVVTSLRQPRPVNSTKFSKEEYGGIQYYRSSEDDWKFARAIRELGVPVLREVSEVLPFETTLKKIAQSLSSKIIHAHSPILVGYPSLRVARQLGLPFVYEIRAFWEDAAVDQNKIAPGSLRYRLTHYFETKLVQKSDAVVVICEGLRNDLLARDIKPDKIFVVPNGVDTEVFVPTPTDTALRAELGFTGKTVVGYIGTFFNFEGLRYLVEAMERLRERNDIVCLIVGYGEADGEIRRIVDKLGLAQRVHFTGKVPSDKVKSYYSIIDILVYPRINCRITELVTPLKPLEAMAMGKTVLASNVGGLRELITDGQDGILFKPENVTDLSEKICYLVEKEDLCRELGRRARENMLAKRSWEDNVRRYREVYSYAQAVHAHKHNRS